MTRKRLTMVDKLDPAELPVGVRSRLLDGVKVLDLTRFLAGPFGSLILADMGADVLKVEPLTGDSTRGTPPFEEGGTSAYFLSINRNKASIALDPGTPQGKEVLQRLIAQHDIVLDNMRAEQRVGLGLDFESLRKTNPRIISVSVTGYGSDGPYSDRPAYDIIVEAFAGVMSLTGPIGGPSVRAGVPIGDIVGGMYLTIGALGALQYRNSTGLGQHVDVSMLDSQISLLSYLAQFYITAGILPSHQGREHISYPTYNTFTTSDGEIVVAAMEPKMWAKLCHLAGLDRFLTDERLQTAVGRLEHKKEVVDAFNAAFSTFTTEEAYSALVEADLPGAPINNIEGALRDPQVRHRDMVVRARGDDGQDVVTLGTPIKTFDAQGDDFIAAPRLGNSTISALTEAGYDQSEIDELIAADVVRILKEPE